MIPIHVIMYVKTNIDVGVFIYEHVLLCNSLCTLYIVYNVFHHCMCIVCISQKEKKKKRGILIYFSFEVETIFNQEGYCYIVD